MCRQSSLRHWPKAYEAVGGYVDRFRDVFRFQRGVEGWAFLLTSVEEDMETQTKAFN